MFNCIALTGTAFLSVANFTLSVGLVLYLLVIGGYRNLVRPYAMLYMYLFATALCTVMGALFLWIFGLKSWPYYYFFQLGAGILVLLKYLVVCWLYWLVLSKDYPTIRFSFVMVFVVSVGIFLFWFAIHPPPGHSQGVFIEGTIQRIAKYFTTAQMLLLAILSVVIYAFKISISTQLKGILGGLLIGLVLGLGYDSVKYLNAEYYLGLKPFLPYLHPIPYLAMLSTFCYYLSSSLKSISQCPAPGLKSIDEKLFQVLALTPLYNRFTDLLFFGFFDPQTATDFTRWKQCQKRKFAMQRSAKPKAESLPKSEVEIPRLAARR